MYNKQQAKAFLDGLEAFLGIKNNKITSTTKKKKNDSSNKK
jgi:hypothetical protein